MYVNFVNKRAKKKKDGSCDQVVSLCPVLFNSSRNGPAVCPSERVGKHLDWPRGLARQFGTLAT